MGVDITQPGFRVFALLFYSNVSLERSINLSVFFFSRKTEMMAFVKVRKDTEKVLWLVHLGTR